MTKHANGRPANPLDRVAKRLREMGVGTYEATALLGACVEDRRRVLAVVTLPAEPREGDRLRVKGVGGAPPQAMRVLAAARATLRPKAWAVVGDPVEASSKDDIVLPAPRRTRGDVG